LSGTVSALLNKALSFYLEVVVKQLVQLLFILTIVLVSFALTKIKPGILFFGFRHYPAAVSPSMPETAVSSDRPSQIIAIKDLKKR
jgi:hypothetical protein